MPETRYVDIDYSPDYALHTTHTQRITSEFRVPLFEGWTMAPSTHDSESAAMYKSLLLRSLSVEVGEEPEDVRRDKAFAPLCTIEGETLDGNEAPTRRK